jgi:hypothetical protein
MKWLLLITVLLAGCAKVYPPEIVIEGTPRRIDGAAGTLEQPAWYNADQLDAIVRAYARDNKVPFNFRGSSALFSVPRNRDYLADADYSSGLGNPVLLAKIGWDGQVIEHWVGVSRSRAAMGPSSINGAATTQSQER